MRLVIDWRAVTFGGTLTGNEPRPATLKVKLLQQLSNLRKLAGTVDLRVARQHMLDQSRAGARHSKDEDGDVGRIAQTLFLAEEFGREDGYISAAWALAPRSSENSE